MLFIGPHTLVASVSGDASPIVSHWPQIFSQHGCANDTMSRNPGCRLSTDGQIW